MKDSINVSKENYLKAILEAPPKDLQLSFDRIKLVPARPFRRLPPGGAESRLCPLFEGYGLQSAHPRARVFEK